MLLQCTPLFQFLHLPCSLSCLPQHTHVSIWHPSVLDCVVVYIVFPGTVTQTAAWLHCSLPATSKLYTVVSQHSLKTVDL